MAQYGQELHLDMHSKNAHPIMRMTAGGVYIVDVHITENGIDAFDDYVSRITTGLNGNTYLAIRWAENSAARWWLSDAGIDSENKCLSFAVKAPDKVSGRAVGYLAIDYMRSQLFFVDVESANLSYDTPAETNVKYQELTKAQYDALATKDPDTLYKVNHAGNYTYYIGNSILASEYGLITKNITQNGTYNATDDSADGYSSVLVNVSSGADYVQDGLEIQSKNIGRGVTAPTLINPSQYKTIECCFKWDSVNATTNMGRAISIENSGGEIFAININQNFTNNVEWKAGSWTDDGASGITMVANTYHTLSFVFFEENNVEKVSVYYDGTKVITQNGSLGTSNVIRICFKQSFAYTDRQLDGNIKNFRVYSRALTDNEILLNYDIDQSRYV